LRTPAIVIAMAVAASARAQDPGASVILDQIVALEGQRDPKCYATASRLEDFMYGTPLDFDARAVKIERQRELVTAVWRDAGAVARDGGHERITAAQLDPVLDRTVPARPIDAGDWWVATVDGALVTIDAHDLRQYGNVAYSLRTILSVEQDSLLGILPGGALPALEADALDVLVRRLDLASLAALQLADRAARDADAYTIDAVGMNAAWRRIVPAATAEAPPTTPPPAAGSPTHLLPQVVARKVAAYEAYNDVSMPVFLRNLQVYFARHPWPRDPQAGTAFRDGFNQALVHFATDVMNGASQVAADRGSPVVRLEDMEAELQRFLPFEANEYEDITYFPSLPADERVTIEAYDLDAFRDSGLHWKVLEWMLASPELKATREPDPFAAELLAEGVAQLGVMVLRFAGEHAKRDGAPTLRPDDLVPSLQRVQALNDRHAASPRVDPPTTASLVSSPGVPPPAGASFFTDVTSVSGVDVVHRTSDWLSRRIRSYTPKGENVANLVIPPAFGGSGIAAEDLDGDGDHDLLVLSGAGTRLFANTGDGGFRDVTGPSGLDWRRPADDTPGEPRQPIVADLDNDGLQDVVVTYVDDHHRIYRNVGGLRFEDVTDRAGLGGPGSVGGPATALDVDGDGLLDLYIGYFGNYLVGELPTLARRNLNGEPNRLFRNLGGFRFEDVTAGSGTDDTGWAQAVGHTDLDLDGRQDLIVGNDFGVNAYLRNNGDGTFTDVAPLIGTDKPSYTMNIGLADLNRDGYPDVYISNIVTMDKDQKYVLPNERMRMKFDPDTMAHMRVVEANDLFVSSPGPDGLPRYHQSEAIGRGRSSTGWSWDADFFDFDNDGDEDLYCVNGMNEFALYSSENPYYTAPDGTPRDVLIPVADRESNVFFVNRDGRLVNESTASGADLLGNSRSVAYFDLEGDGDLDMAVNNFHGPAVLYRNNSQANGNNWIAIRLEGDPIRGVSRDAIGTRLVVSSAHHREMWRQVSSTIGYLSVHPKQQHVGLGVDTEADVVVHWPNGQRTEVHGLPANTVHVLRLEDLAPGDDRSPASGDDAD
jgi:hypothetical protein